MTQEEWNLKFYQEVVYPYKNSYVEYPDENTCIFHLVEYPSNNSNDKRV